MDLNHSKGTIYGGEFKSEISLHQDNMSSMVLFAVWSLTLSVAYKSTLAKETGLFFSWHGTYCLGWQ